MCEQLTFRSSAKHLILTLIVVEERYVSRNDWASSLARLAMCFPSAINPAVAWQKSAMSETARRFHSLSVTHKARMNINVEDPSVRSGD